MTDTAELIVRLRLVLDLLAAEDGRQTKLHDLLETIREQIRLEVAPEHRPAALFINIQNAVYAMRGRTPLMNDAAIVETLREAASALTALQAERDFASARADCFTLEIERLEANAELLHARLAAGANPTRLKPEDVEWVVNDNAELGVKIGDQFFFLYKGRSLVYGLLNEDPTQPPEHDAGGPMHWRPVFKREFGECAHPINYADLTKIGTVSLDDSDDWKELPPAMLAKVNPHD